MKPDRPVPYPEADLAGLIAPTPDAAVARVAGEGRHGSHSPDCVEGIRQELLHGSSGPQLNL